MKSIKVNGSLTIELKNKFYVVESDVYYYDDIVNYPENTIILFRDALFKTKKPVTGVTPVDGEYYTLVKATDEVSDYARLDQVITHEDLSNFVEKKDLDLYITKEDVQKNYVAKINDNIEIYVGKNDGDDKTGDGSPEKPFKTFQRALDFLYNIDANHKSITINLAQGLDESGKIYKLQRVNTRYGLAIVKGVGRDEIKLGQMYVADGRWFFDNVTFTGTAAGDHVLEVCDDGQVSLARVKFKVQNAKQTTDAIKIHNGGKVVLSAAGHLSFENNSNTKMRSAIHTRSNGLFSGGVDYTFNEDRATRIDVLNSNGGFATVFLADHASTIAYLDNVSVSIGGDIKRFESKNNSIIEGLRKVTGGTEGTSDNHLNKVFFVNIPFKSLTDTKYTKDTILSWFNMSEQDLKFEVNNNSLFVFKVDDLKIPLQYIKFETENQIKCLAIGFNNTSFKVAKYEITMNLDQTTISGNSNVSFVISDLNI